MATELLAQGGGAPGEEADADEADDLDDDLDAELGEDIALDRPGGDGLTDV